MKHRMKKLFLPMLMLGAVACNEANAPVIDEAPESSQRLSLNHLRWAGPQQFTASATSLAGDIDVLAPEYGALFDGGSGDYTASFWAVRGQWRELKVYYEDVDEELEDEGKFLDLEITDPVALADGTPIAVGDSVLVTVTVDANFLTVQLEPSGIQFGTGNPTELQISYRHADPDYNNDGVVNGDDAYVESNLLDMWVQEDPNDPWVSVFSYQSTYLKRFFGTLEHFSEYAISW